MIKRIIDFRYYIALAFAFICCFSLLMVCFFVDSGPKFYASCSIKFNLLLNDISINRVDKYHETKAFFNDAENRLLSMEKYDKSNPISFSKFKYEWFVSEEKYQVLVISYHDDSKINLSLFCDTNAQITVKNLQKLNINIAEKDCVISNSFVYSKTNDEIAKATYIVVPISLVPIVGCFIWDFTNNVTSFMNNRKAKKEQC